MPARPPIFRDKHGLYKPDTCAPLKAAAEKGLVRVDGVCHGLYPGRHLPSRLLPEIRAVGCWDAAVPQPWGLDWHRNEGIEITYLARGRLAFSVEGQESILRRGQLTITRPWQRHRVGNPAVTPSRLHWLILDVGVRRPDQPWRWPGWLILPQLQQRRLTTLLRHNEQSVWEADSNIGGCFEKIAAIVGNSAGALDSARLMLLINELLLALREMLDGRRISLDHELTSTQRSVQLFLDELPTRCEHPWTVDEMAEQCGLGRSRFTHYCRQITNRSPLEYLLECRIARARELLGRGEMTITQIAMACGFASSQYFATVFRRATGHAPREMRVADHS